jgi:hypothetical protein
MTLPQCPNFLKKGTCPKSDPILLGETDGGGRYYSFGCRTCRCTWALSKEWGTQETRYQAAIQHAREQGELERRKRLDRKWFI